MPLSVDELVQAIHEASEAFVIALSGGGSVALTDLLTTPGASRTVLEAIVPYSEEALIAWLGSRPDQFCSSRTARAMAMVAFRRGCRYRDAHAAVAGLACTASLATDRPKLGPHRAHLALQTASVTACWSLSLEKGARTRREEEALVGRLLLNAMAETCDVDAALDLGLSPDETVENLRTVAPPPWQSLLLGEVETISQGQTPVRPCDARRAIFPGEFNPMHVGHQRMRQMAGDILGALVELEISITNVDKPPLDYLEIQRRVSQFGPEQPVWLSRAARFTEKSRLFPMSTFVVGIDTLRRIAAPRYYGDDRAACEAAIELIASRGCRFLVFGRNLGTGFVSLRDLDLPPKLAALCTEVPADKFREDITSTSIRRAGQW